MTPSQLSSRQIIALMTHLGPGWVARRVAYQVRRRSGALRRSMPPGQWSDVPVVPLRLAADQQPAARLVGPEGLGEAEEILRGTFRLFSHHTCEAGPLPDWHRNRLVPGGENQSGGSQEEDLPHWTTVSDSAGGDIKGVWELSRFSWAFPLTRAFARTGDGKYRDAFWRLFSDWCEHNPPNRGANWMCGQEASFRFFATVFAAEGLGVPPGHEAGLARFVVATGRRIAANLDYALRQQNNHGISESIGLLTAALLVPSAPEASAWSRRALSALRDQLAELVYADGGFAQHSLIYHRVLLHDLCWAVHRLRRHEKEIPVWLTDAGGRALDFLIALTDLQSGEAPLYGANDGANVLPLSDGAFLDMRPVLQSAAALFRGELILPPGPWDEAAMWLRPDAPQLPRVSPQGSPELWHAAIAGCALLRHGGDRLFLRCPTRFLHRPSHADMLHVDVWHRGRAVTHDGGSYSYNSRDRFSQLGTAAHHNVMVVDGIEPMQKFSRFLYLPWPRGECVAGGDAVRATHDGYAPLGIGCTRTVAARAGGGFTVTDRVTGAGGRVLRWHWRLADGPWHLTEAGVEAREGDWAFAVRWRGATVTTSCLVRVAEDSAWGWWAPWYGAAVPAWALLVEASGSGPHELVTDFVPLN